MRTVRWWPMGKPTSDAPTFTGERFTVGEGGEMRIEHLHRYLWASCGSQAGEWLDAACGSGYGTFLIASSGNRTTGLDVDPESVNLARETFRSAGENLEFSTGSVTALPFERASFDTIISFETIEHVDEPRLALAEFAKCLRADGRLLISSPNKATYSDHRPTENAFHRFEYYEAEFFDDVSKYFESVRLYGQWTFGSASLIAPLDQGAGWLSNAFWLNGATEAVELDTAFEPRYFLAEASNVALGDERTPSIAFDSFWTESLETETRRLTNDIADLRNLLDREREKALADIEAVRRDVSDLVRLNQSLEERYALVRRELNRYVQSQ